MNYLNAKFESIGFDFSFKINYFLSLEEFGQILGIPDKGDCSFSDKWSLDDLPYSVPTGGPYQMNPPSPDDIKLPVQIERRGVVTRIRHEQEIVVEDNQNFTREITNVMKTWIDIILENVFCLVEIGITSPRVSCCRQQERRDSTRIMHEEESRPHTFLLSAFGQPSSSHPNDDDNDGNDEGTSCASTPSPTHFVNSLTNEVPQVFSNPPNIDPNMEPFYTRKPK
ncbi:hypothetical protein Tco_0949953 [Tanacetum coccineum]